MVDLGLVNDKELVDLVVAAMKVAEDAKSALEQYRAEIQNRGLSVSKDRNNQYCRIYGTDGSYVAVSEPKEVDTFNMSRSKQATGEDVCTELMVETMKTTHIPDRKLQKALKATTANGYTFEYILEDCLKEMSVPVSEDRRKVPARRLKGDYKENKKTLLSVLGYLDRGITEGAVETATPNLDTDLYYISKIKSTELIQAILPDEGTGWNVDEIRWSLVVTSKLKLGIAYEREGK